MDPLKGLGSKSSHCHCLFSVSSYKSILIPLTRWGFCLSSSSQFFPMVLHIFRLCIIVYSMSLCQNTKNIYKYQNNIKVREICPSQIWKLGGLRSRQLCEVHKGCFLLPAQYLDATSHGEEESVMEERPGQRRDVPLLLCLLWGI